MTARALWDTVEPEEMILMARNVSLHKQIDKKVIAELVAEVETALKESGATQLSSLRHVVYLYAHTQMHHYDVSVVIETKGGWHG